MFARSAAYSTAHPCRQPVLVSGTAAGLFVVVAVLPALLMLAKSLLQDGWISLTHYQAVFADGRVFDLLLKSVSIAMGATVLALIVGLPFVILLVRYEFPTKRLIRLCYLVPLFIPPHIHALAWINLLGEKGVVQTTLTTILQTESPVINIHTPAGAAAILFLAYCPIMILITTTGLARIDRRMEEAASFHAGPWRVWWRVTLPLLGPYLFSGLLFVFLFSFFNYGVPSMLRVPTFPVEILTQFSAFYNEAGAAALAAPLIILAICLLYAHDRSMEGLSLFTMEGASRQTTLQRGYYRYAGSVGGWGFVLVTVVFPVVALIIDAGSLQAFKAAWNTSAGEIGTSIALSFGAATLAVVLAFFLARSIADSSGAGKRWLNMLTLLPFAFPAPLFGIGLVYLWNRPATQFIYGGIAILVIAYIARFIPFGIRVVLAAMQQVNPRMREAACLHQGSSLKRVLQIELPLAGQGLSVCWMVVFLFSMGELGATLLVVPPGTGTLSLKIYTLMHYGAGNLVAALAIMLIFINIAFSAVIFQVFNRKEQWQNA